MAGRIERLTTDRAKAKVDDTLARLNLEHPLFREFMAEYRALPAEHRSLRGGSAMGLARVRRSRSAV